MAAAAVGNNRHIPFAQHPNNILDQVIAIAKSVQQLVRKASPEFWSLPLNVESTEQYYQWKGGMMQRDVYPIISEDIEEHEKLKPFLCPITIGVITHPVRDENGILFEKEIIESHLDDCQKKGIQDEVTHPLRIGVLTKESLKYDPLYHGSLIKALKEALASTTLTSNQREILDRAINPVQLMQQYVKETPPEGWSVSLVMRVLENMRNTLMNEAARLLEKEERTVDAISDASLKYPYLYEIALARIQWNDYEGSLNMLNKVLEVAKAIKNPRGKCDAFKEIAAGYIELGNKRGARKALEWAQNAAYEMVDGTNYFCPRSDFLEKIVELLIKLEDLDEAKTVAATIFDPAYKSLAYSNIALAYIKLGKKGSAQMLLQEAMEVMNKSPADYLYSYKHWKEKIIRAHLLLNGLEKAKEISREIGNYREIVMVYIERGELETAKEIAYKFINPQDKSDKYFLLTKIAEAYYQQGNLTEAKKILNEAKKEAVKLPGGTYKDTFNDEIFNLIASGYIQINELDEAKRVVSLIKDEGSRSFLLDKIALVHMENPHDIQTLKESETSARNGLPHNKITVLKKIALAYLRLNRLDYAQDILKELEKIATDPLEIKEVVSLHIAFNDFDSATKAANATSIEKIRRIAYEEIINVIHNSILKMGKVVSTNRISREERRFVTLNTLR
ncbi:MAG: hypothetical protein PVI40_04525 [Chlamydiota bacterium]